MSYIRSSLRVMYDVPVAPLSPIHTSPTCSTPTPAVQQMPREGSYHLHCHRFNSNHSKPNSETRLAAENVPGGPGGAQMKEAPVAVVRGG